MLTLKSDLSSRICPEPIDFFDQLPDVILLLIFNNICDVRALGRCCAVSRRFRDLVPQVDNVVVRVDCVISDDNSSSSASSVSSADKSRNPISSLLRLVLSGILKPLQSLTQLISTSPRRGSGSSTVNGDEFDQNSVTHHSPIQVLKNFNEIKSLKMELPSGELGIEDGVLLKWRADFGSTLDNCVILGASSVIRPISSGISNNGVSNMEDQCRIGYENGINNIGEPDNGSIPESFYTNGGLKLRVLWTISSLIAGSARHYLLQSIIAAHKTLDSLVLTDADGQGVLCMSKEQVDELRVKPLSASSASKRTMVPALNMRLWYAPHLELPDGTVLKGATLVAIRPSEHPKKDVIGTDENCLSMAFEEPYKTAARMLVKRRTYCLEMNSF